MAVVYKECVEEDCQAEFYITERDQEYFADKDLELPKRCWSCRQKRKRERNEAKAKQDTEERSLRMNGNRKPGRAPRDKYETVWATDRSRQGRGR